MRLVIYGAGAEGQRALLDVGKENVLCLVDKQKTGTVLGCPIYSLSQISASGQDDLFFLITPRKYQREIADDLVAAGYHHFCLYTHIHGGGTARALDASQWGELYNQQHIQNVVDDVKNKRQKSWSREMLSLTKPGNRVLEIGCGSGATTLHLAAQQRICTAIDYSQVSIYSVREAAKRLGLNVQTQLVDARKKLPFGAHTFDFVFQAGLLEHFHREERVHLLESWKVVGRTMVSMIPNANSIAYRAGKFLQEQSGDWAYGMELPQATMMDEFAEAGFSHIREYTIGIEDAFAFLPADNYLRTALEKWFAKHHDDFFGQGYLLCTIGENETR